MKMSFAEMLKRVQHDGITRFVRYCRHWIADQARNDIGVFGIGFGYRWRFLLVAHLQCQINVKYGKIVAMRKKLTTIVMSIILISALTSGCSSFDKFSDSLKGDEAISIGVFEPLTGDYAKDGKLELLGIELAHSLYPSVSDRPIVLITADNQSDLTAAHEKATELVEQKVSAVIGSYDSALTLAGAKVFNPAGIPGVAATNKNPIVTNSENAYFRVCPLDSDLGNIPESFEIADKSSEMYLEFLAAFKAKYGEDSEPELASALAFDAYLLVYKAIEAAGPDYNLRMITEKIKTTTDLPGATGAITLDENGNRVQ
jgi:ABC-type branched-subunit amino acid transport system substrate-binding protein